MSYKIIVADDCMSVQRVIRIAFPDEEFDIYPFEDGKEVIKAVANINPDAVLLSLSLPGKDGYEVGSYLKSHRTLNQIPLILLRGAFEQTDKERIAELDYEEIVSEPFASEELVNLVRNIIERKRAPLTLPEEPAPAEIPMPESERISDESTKELLKGEILEMERELEKRIRARVFSDIKEWIQTRKQEKRDKEKE